MFMQKKRMMRWLKRLVRRAAKMSNAPVHGVKSGELHTATYLGYPG